MLGLVCGLFMLLVGRDIMDAINTGSYNTVLGIEVITSLVATIGGVICIASLLGIVVGVWNVVMHSQS